MCKLNLLMVEWLMYNMIDFKCSKYDTYLWNPKKFKNSLLLVGIVDIKTFTGLTNLSHIDNVYLPYYNFINNKCIELFDIVMPSNKYILSRDAIHKITIIDSNNEVFIICRV